MSDTSKKRRYAKAGLLRRPVRATVHASTNPIVTPQIEVVAGAPEDLVCADTAQVVAG